MSTASPSIICKACGEEALYDFHKGSYSCATCLQARRRAAELHANGRSSPPTPAPPALDYPAASATPSFDASPAALPTSAATSSAPPPASATDLPPVSDGPELALAELERRYKLAGQEAENDEVALCSCQGCGAQVESAASASLATCPFCDRTTVVKQSASTVSLQDSIVVPFSLDLSLAVGKMTDHLGKLWLRPSFLRRMIVSCQHVKKVYLPFWAFDVCIDTSWNAQATRWKEPGFFAKLFGAKGKYETTHHSGGQEQRLQEWLVCASQGLDADLIEGLQPFSFSQTSPQPFAEAVGEVATERGSLSPADGWERAKIEIRRRQYRASLEKAKAAARLDDDEGISIDGKVDFEAPVGKAVVLPLYIFSARTPYGRALLAVNGQTGQVASKIPYSWLKAGPVGAATTAATLFVCVATMGGFTPVLVGVVGWSWYKKKKQREHNEATFMSR